jgi:hypothetical protein
MAIQTDDLVMAALSVVNDSPSNPLQTQPLVTGIHLRIAFAREHGFPWNGFYLFRREHGKGRQQCIASQFPNEWNLDVSSSTL